VADPAVAPVPVTVIVLEEEAVGVPEITPVDELIAKPAGRLPEVTAYVTEPVKLEAVIVDELEIALFTEPEIVWVEGLKLGPTIVTDDSEP
jgi:hypothetical protein